LERYRKEYTILLKTKQGTITGKIAGSRKAGQELI